MQFPAIPCKSSLYFSIFLLVAEQSSDLFVAMEYRMRIVIVVITIWYDVLYFCCQSNSAL